jgi:hypothetical protein
VSTELRRVDLARQALVAAREAAKKNGATGKEKPKRRTGTVVRRDGREDPCASLRPSGRGSCGQRPRRVVKERPERDRGAALLTRDCPDQRAQYVECLEHVQFGFVHDDEQHLFTRPEASGRRQDSNEPSRITGRRRRLR